MHLWLALVLLAGCDEDGGSTAVTLSGAVTEFIVDSTAEGPPVPEVEVCQFGSFNCATTDENGQYALRVLKNREIELSYLKDGYGSVIVAQRSGVVDFVGNAVLATDEVLEAFAESLMTVYPPIATGFITAVTYRGPTADGDLLDGVSYALEGSQGVSFYLDDAGLPDTSLVQTSPLGAGGFIEVSPRNVDLRVMGAANCTSEPSWSAAATNTFRLPVRAGFLDANSGQLPVEDRRRPVRRSASEYRVELGERSRLVESVEGPGFQDAPRCAKKGSPRDT